MQTKKRSLTNLILAAKAGWVPYFGYCNSSDFSDKLLNETYRNLTDRLLEPGDTTMWTGIISPIQVNYFDLPVVCAAILSHTASDPMVRCKKEDESWWVRALGYDHEMAKLMASIDADLDELELKTLVRRRTPSRRKLS